MKKFLLAFFFTFLVLFVSCAESNKVNKLINFFSMKDNIPPVLQEVFMEDEETVIIIFNEDVIPINNAFLSEYTVYGEKNRIMVGLNKTVDAGMNFNISGSAEDMSGNTVNFNVNVWGFNPNPAKLIINEFTTKGTERQPDRVELLVLKSGNTAGITIYDGVPDNYKSSVILTDLQVKKGDYIVLWWMEKLPDGISSFDGKSVYNICSESSGLSDNNGIITVFHTPSLYSDMMDTVVYSSMTSTQYDGFGTKAVYERVKTALDNNWWSGEAINTSNTTSTRSICRRLDTEDTDTSFEWFITVTSGLTFGSENNKEEYRPQNN